MKENKDKGFLKLNRGFFEHSFWNEKRIFSAAEAWLYLLSVARFEDEEKQIRIKGKQITIKKGQLIASVRYLKQAWNWGSNGKVQRFIKQLECERMIVTETEQRETVITIVKYEFYNNTSSHNGTSTEHEQNMNGTIAEHEQNKTKNLKNIRTKEDKKGGGMPKGDTSRPTNTEIFIEEEVVNQETGPDDYVLPAELKDDYLAVQKFVMKTKVLSKKRMITPFEYEKLRGDYTAEMILTMLPVMEDHKKMANHTTIYFTLLNWLKRDHGGNREDQEMIDKYLVEYKAFVLRESGSEPRMDWKQNKSIRELYIFFKDRSKQKTPEAILKNFQYVLQKENWDKLEPFLRNRINAAQILTDISNILKQINQDGTKNKPNSKGTDTAQRKDFA